VARGAREWGTAGVRGSRMGALNLAPQVRPPRFCLLLLIYGGWSEGNLDDPGLLVVHSDQAGGYGMRDLIRCTGNLLQYHELTCMIVV